MGGVSLGFFCLFSLFGFFLRAHCMVACEELVTGFVVVIVRVGLLFFFFPLFAL